jgi:hypothetical protein
MKTAPRPTVERLEAALRLAERLGYRIRLESLVGHTGGGCEIRGQKWLFVDLSLTPREQLEQVLATLRREAASLRAKSAVRDRPEAGILRCAQNDSSVQNDTGVQNDGGSPNDAAQDNTRPKSAQGFLLRWRRWYRMLVRKQTARR